MLRVVYFCEVTVYVYYSFKIKEKKKGHGIGIKPRLILVAIFGTTIVLLDDCFAFCVSKH